tara:strand:+ start:41 stop:889 length:849 start_codon:yes stop_codon:yes gene_type:complete
MSMKKHTEPTDEEQRLLAAWRTFFETHCKADFAALAEIEDSVWGFEIQWEVLEAHQGLGLAFMSDRQKCLDSGTLVLEEQFALHNLEPRPVIRIVGFSELNRYHIEDLRMRDRTRFLRFDAVVHSISRAMGWLKRSAYSCRECKHEWIEKEQLARARRKLEICPMCMKNGIAFLRDGGKHEDLPDPRNFGMDLERNYYEDVQYMELFDPNSLRNDELPEDVPTIMAVVSDEYVNQFKPGQCLTVNAAIGLDHLPSRDYLRDTRRILRLDVHSVEEGFSLHEE